MEFKNLDEVYDYVQNKLTDNNVNAIKDKLNKVKEYGFEDRVLEILNSQDELQRSFLKGETLEGKLMREKLPDSYDYEAVKEEWRRRHGYDKESLPSDKFAWVIPDEKFSDMALDVAFEDVLGKEEKDTPTKEYRKKVKDYYQKLMDMYMDDEKVFNDWYVMTFAYRTWYISFVPDVPWDVRQ